MDKRTLLVSLLTQNDAVRCAKEIKRYGRANIYALSIELGAVHETLEPMLASGATWESAFSETFTPTRANHGIARKLGLALDVERGQWIDTTTTRED